MEEGKGRVSATLRVWVRQREAEGGGKEASSLSGLCTCVGGGAHPLAETGSTLELFLTLNCMV